jgi:hypothetical protein
MVEVQGWFAKRCAMIDLFETAKELQTLCDKNGWLSCFIGGIPSKGGELTPYRC